MSPALVEAESVAEARVILGRVQADLKAGQLTPERLNTALSRLRLQLSVIEGELLGAPEPVCGLPAGVNARFYGRLAVIDGAGHARPLPPQPKGG